MTSFPFPGPWPILGSLDHSRTKRIPLDVPQHHWEVVILLDGEGLEPALPDVSTGMVMPLVGRTWVVKSQCIQRLRSPSLAGQRARWK